MEQEIRRKDQWSPACPGVRVWRGTAADDVERQATSRAFAFWLWFLFYLALFDHVYLTKFQLKCSKVFIPNL
jgi:hypothetical protein